MKASEIRLLSAGEIKAKIAEARQEQMNLRFQDVMGQVKDYSRVRQVRREIARMETILHEMEAKSEGKA